MIQTAVFRQGGSRRRHHSLFDAERSPSNVTSARRLRNLICGLLVLSSVLS